MRQTASDTDDPETLRRACVRALRIADIGSHFALPDLPMPRDYPLAEGAWSGNRRPPQRKYLQRRRNLVRAVRRIQLYLPELMGGPPRRVFELSTGHGAMLEVLRHYGHAVLGNDFANMVNGSEDGGRSALRALNDPGFSRRIDDYGIPIPADGQIADWPYRPITDSIGLPMALFDAGHLPYPLDSGSQDYVLCLQAIEHYCHPGHWLAVVDEMCRIATTGVFVLLNPMMQSFAADPGYRAAFDTFRAGMRAYDRGGFRCVGVHLHWGQALGFKLLRLGGKC
ncbi:hypothetical protein [Rhodovulum strictum]|uniref:Methyltransferase domain-containing protein n=1 Tax=Rhodovulum strictum TaxID=58314 RepID=A0A844B3B8_9RHOB|nr:hypothetical protein [Rhodovulum strictum]MRH20631.1 hypothetical protein [Rhodovulum strictum]